MYDVQKIALEENNFPAFNEMQEKALRARLLERSLVVSAPTAAGKTILLELCALNIILNNKKKAVYTCPLRALAAEHYNDFKRKYSKKFGIKVALSIGDLDSSSAYLKGYDIIFTTYEKMESLLRHKAEWLSSVGLLVVDEIHELDSDRGPTVEMVVTKMRLVCPQIQLIALSATIPNAGEIALWLDAGLVESNFRPVELLEGVYFNGEFMHTKGKEKVQVGREPITSVISDTLSKQKQALVFASTRKSAESNAKKLSLLTQKTISEKEKEKLLQAAKKILSTLEFPTEQCESLAGLVEKGAAFHHAGLMQKQREIVEDIFRDGTLKLISSTPTLAAGINLPAFRVVIPSIYRYTEMGNQPITVREYRQMSGRAGRPKFHEAGESMLLARSELEAQELFENFVKGKMEDVSSKLGIEPVLRTHLLGLIASSFVFDLSSMEDFFSKTFYFRQFGNNQAFFQKLSMLLQDLKNMGFVQTDDKRFTPTPIGRRVSELFLDPLSAHKMITSLKKEMHEDMSYLYVISNTSEMYPFFSIPKKAEVGLCSDLEENKLKLPIEVEKEMYFDQHMLKKFNTAMVFHEWINEAHEERFSKEFGVQPGILHSKKRIAEWLVFSSFELSKILGLTGHLPFLSRLEKRLQYGVRAELLQLVELRGIGRVRARRLYNANVKTILDVKKIDIADLSKIIPPAVAEKVKGQVKS